MEDDQSGLLKWEQVCVWWGEICFGWFLCQLLFVAGQMDAPGKREREGRRSGPIHLKLL